MYSTTKTHMYADSLGTDENRDPKREMRDIILNHKQQVSFLDILLLDGYTVGSHLGFSPQNPTRVRRGAATSDMEED